MAVFGILKRRFLAFRREAVVLWYAFRDPRTPRWLRLASLATGLYLLNPIDLIPFTIPLLGVVDDLIIVPAAVGFISKRLPAAVHQEAGEKADRWIARWFKRPLLAAAVILGILVVIWAVLLYLIYRWLAG
ncbi:YkvA family protein [Aquamicrobium lusatiense]|uniref:YkvA family protein n=1 Tax=Aquamicrobium lusatiense TaxID=89772 RepID=UPI00245825E5|nr:YkvA family protein [Aquamicrobium lusatiense]MDH4991658.1 YkvA family protein [Aquamicrobium lusatiense]